MIFLQNIGQEEPQTAGTAELLSTSFDKMLTSLTEQIPYIAGGLIVLVLFWFVAKLVKSLFLFGSRKALLEPNLRALVSRILVVAIVIIGIFTSLTIIIPNFGFTDLIAGLGFSSFVVGFATKDILNNFLSGMLVLWQQPFKLGDFVSVDKFEGEVKEIGIRATQLRMFDGEQVLIPNSQMYSSALIIKPAGAAQRVKIEIVTDYESSVGKSKKLILEALKTIDGVNKDPEPNVLLTRLGSEGIKLTVFFWVDTEHNSVMVLFDNASQAINRGLREGGVKLFPAQRLTISDSESGSIKPDAL